MSCRLIMVRPAVAVLGIAGFGLLMGFHGSVMGTPARAAIAALRNVSTSLRQRSREFYD